MSTQNKTQRDRFKEAARKLEADDGEAAFNAKPGQTGEAKASA